MKPLAKWPGGKRRLLPQLIPLLPPLGDIHTYIEPFAGSAALFFALDFDTGDRITLSDKNGALIDMYRCVRDFPDKVLQFLKVLADAHDAAPAERYAHVRAEFNNGIGSPVERAAMFLYLNRTCFNGIWRVNGDGKFNVPIGDYRNPKIYNRELLLAAHRKLSDPFVQLSCIDFGPCVFDALINAPAQAFVYLDPPYVPVSATADFTSYTIDGFGAKDLERLRRCCLKLDELGVQWMLSNSDTPEVHNTFSEHNITTITRRGNINSDIKKRGDVTELVIRNYG